jgi:hypothetical protein
MGKKKMASNASTSEAKGAKGEGSNPNRSSYHGQR